MLNPTKAGILITLGIFTDLIQLVIAGVSLGIQGTGTVVTLGLGTAAATAAGFAVSITGILFSLFSGILITFFVVQTLYFQTVLKKDLVGTLKKRLSLKIFIYIFEFLPVLNVLPFWTIQSIAISLMKPNPKKKKEGFL